MTKRLLSYLTWKDIRDIVKMADEVIDEVKKGQAFFYTEESYYRLIQLRLKTKCEKKRP